jgi:hypothetical protein
MNSFMSIYLYGLIHKCSLPYFPTSIGIYFQMRLGLRIARRLIFSYGRMHGREYNLKMTNACPSCRYFSKPNHIRLPQLAISSIFDHAAIYCRSTRSFRLMDALLSYLATKLLCI